MYYSTSTHYTDISFPYDFCNNISQKTREKKSMRYEICCTLRRPIVPTVHQNLTNTLFEVYKTSPDRHSIGFDQHVFECL